MLVDISTVTHNLIIQNNCQCCMPSIIQDYRLYKICKCYH